MSLNQEIHTKEKLIKLWLEKYPNDKAHPDLEQMALAGYVHLKEGGYIHYGYYNLLKGIVENTESV